MSKIKVEDDYRKNELSLEPGGIELTVVYKDGSRRVYDKIKNIKAYASRAMTDQTVIQIWQGDSLFWERKQ